MLLIIDVPLTPIYFVAIFLIHTTVGFVALGLVPSVVLSIALGSILVDARNLPHALPWLIGSAVAVLGISVVSAGVRAALRARQAAPGSVGGPRSVKLVAWTLVGWLALFTGLAWMLWWMVRHGGGVGFGTAGMAVGAGVAGWAQTKYLALVPRKQAIRFAPGLSSSQLGWLLLIGGLLLAAVMIGVQVLARV